jgi:3-oxoacyl-[acyl-carrier protein] reductase
MKELSLLDKVVIITGSSKGIGFAMAKEFAENNGAIVIICSRILENAKEAASLIKGKTFAAKLDVTDDSSVKDFINQIMSCYDRIDVLVNNSGYPFDRNIWYKKFHDGKIEDLDKIIEVDLKGSIRLSKSVIPIMIQNAAKRQSNINETKCGGVIINISSTPAISGYSGGSLYNIVKAANLSLTKCIAKEYALNNIRAYTLALGNIATIATYYAMTEDERINAVKESPMKRWGKPEEIAKVAACIASDSFSFASGNTIVLDGGEVIL